MHPEHTHLSLTKCSFSHAQRASTSPLSFTCLLIPLTSPISTWCNYTLSFVLLRFGATSTAIGLKSLWAGTTLERKDSLVLKSPAPETVSWDSGPSPTFTSPVTGEGHLPCLCPTWLDCKIEMIVLLRGINELIDWKVVRMTPDSQQVLCKSLSSPFYNIFPLHLVLSLLAGATVELNWTN